MHRLRRPRALLQHHCTLPTHWASATSMTSGDPHVGSGAAPTCRPRTMRRMLRRPNAFRESHALSHGLRRPHALRSHGNLRALALTLELSYLARTLGIGEISVVSLTIF